MDACPLLLHRACEVWSGGRVGPAVRDPGTDGPCPLARGQRPGGNQYTISCSLHFRMHPPPPPSVSPASYSPVQVTWVPEITRPSLPVTLHPCSPVQVTWVPEIGLVSSSVDPAASLTPRSLPSALQ